MSHTFTYPSKITLDGPMVYMSKGETKRRIYLGLGIATSEPFEIRQDLERLINSGRKLRVTIELLEV